MIIEEENKAKEYYISSDINGIHTPSRNVVELNQLDLYKLMHGYAQQVLENFIASEKTQEVIANESKEEICPHIVTISNGKVDICCKCGYVVNILAN